MTLRGSFISAYDNLIIRDSVIEITDPGNYTPGSIYNHSSDLPKRQASMTVINSRLIPHGALSCENDLTRINSSVEIYADDGEDSIFLLNVAGKLKMDNMYACYRRKGEDGYRTYVTEKNSDGTYHVDNE